MRDLTGDIFSQSTDGVSFVVRMLFEAKPNTPPKIRQITDDIIAFLFIFSPLLDEIILYITLAEIAITSCYLQSLMLLCLLAPLGASLFYCSQNRNYGILKKININLMLYMNEERVCLFSTR